jgi:hypothetical protein
MANAALRSGAPNSPGLPNRVGVTPTVGGASKRGVFASSDVALVDSVSREYGYVIDNSGFLFRDSNLFC